MSVEDRNRLQLEGIDLDKLNNSCHPPKLNLSFSNEIILLLFQVSGDSGVRLREWLYQLAGLPDEGIDLLPYNSLKKRAITLREKVKNLSKTKKHEEKQALLQEKFNLPSLTVSLLPAAQIMLAAANKENEVRAEVVAARAEAAECSQKLGDLQDVFVRTVTTFQQQNQKVDTIKQDLAGAKRKLNNADRKFKRTKSMVTELRESNVVLRRKSTEECLSRTLCTDCLKKEHCLTEKDGLIAKLKDKIEKLQEEVRDRDLLIGELNDDMSSLASEVIQAKDGRAYSPAVFECAMRLQALAVSQDRVGPVIDTVLRCLVGRRLSSIPSRRTIARTLHAGLLLSQQQIAHSVLDSSAQTLYGDETSKRAKKMFTFVTTDEDGQEFVLGLRETVDKSSLSQINALKSILTDISDSSSGENVVERIVASIKNLMSDRASTQLKFNALFIAWRDECLPIARKDWARLSLNEREKLSAVNAFFCNLHLLANFAEGITTCMSDLESAQCNTQAKPESCAVVTLLRTVAKFFSVRSADKWGIHSKWLTFLDMKNMSHIQKLPSFLGHRFNILFLLAARVFSLRSLIIEFCEKYEADHSVLPLIAASLRDPFVIAQLKVLGLLDKLVTGPLWRLCESDLHILDMSGQFTVLIDWLGANVSDPLDFLNGVRPNFAPSAWTTGSDSCLDELLAASDDSVSEHLFIISKQVMSAAKLYFEASVKDFLTGGKFSEAESSHSLREETRSVLKSNRLPESVFGLTDWLFNRAPSMSMLSMEALVLLIKNKTFEWYDRLSGEQKELHMSVAKKNAKALHSQYLERKAAMAAERQARLEDSRNVLVQRRMQAVAKQSKWTKEMMVYGLWMNEYEVEVGLEKLESDKEKVEALRSQMRFRKYVLKQPGDRKLFAFTEKRIERSWQHLRANLIALLVAAFQVPPSPDTFQIVGKRVDHMFVENGVEKWWTGTVSQIPRGTGPGGSIFYLIVYDTDRRREYSYTAEEIADDINNGNLIVL